MENNRTIPLTGNPTMNVITRSNTILRDYFLTIMVIIKTTSPFFGGAKVVDLVVFVILALMYFSKNGFSIEKKMNLVVIFVIAMITIQGVLFGFKLLTLFTYVASMLLTPYFLFSIIGTKFLRYLINVVYFTSIYSTLFWALQNLIPGIDLFFKQATISVHEVVRLDAWPRSLLFYTIASWKIDLWGLAIYRNNGIFHEAGALAHWLCFCIGLNSVYQRKFFTRKNIIMTLIVLTTFSTAGYLMLFVIMVYWIGIYGRNKVLNVILMAAFVYLSYQTYSSTDFLGQKVEEQLTVSGEGSLEGTKSRGRFVAIRKALYTISRYPITGRGIISSAAETNQYSAEYIGTASLGMIARFGLILGLLYWLYLYRGIIRLFYHIGGDKTYAKIFFVVLIMGGLSQRYFFDNITLQLFLLGLIKNRPVN